MDKRGENHVWLSLCKPDGRDCLRSTCIVLATGAVAILALTLRIPRAGSFALAVPALLAMVLFPGMVLALLLRWDCREQDPPGHLAVWAAAGLSVLAGLGFIGIRTGVTLSGLMTITMMLYAAGMLAIAIRFFSNSTRSEGMEYRKVAVIILVCVAVTLALATLFTPRDTDDWFYLAHIRDYVNDIPINSENAIFDGGQPASPRAWYGGWWVAEAMLSRAAGVDPVRFHQVLCPCFFSHSRCLRSLCWPGRYSGPRKPPISPASSRSSSLSQAHTLRIAPGGDSCAALRRTRPWHAL